MKVMSRTVLFQGPMGEVRQHIVDIQKRASEIMAHEVAAWTIVAGAPVGTTVFGTRVSGLAQVAANGEAAAGDQEMSSLIDEGLAWRVGPSIDRIFTPINGEVGGDLPPVGAAFVTTAAIASGKLSETIAWGLEISDVGAAASELPVLFGPLDGVEVNTVSWLSVGSSLEAVDAANNAISQDAAYLALMDGATDLFVPASGQRLVGVRVA